MSHWGLLCPIFLWQIRCGSDIIKGTNRDLREMSFIFRQGGTI